MSTKIDDHLLEREAFKNKFLFHSWDDNSALYGSDFAPKLLNKIIRD